MCRSTVVAVKKRLELFVTVIELIQVGRGIKLYTIVYI